jgi:hypothetical protein
VTRRCTRAAIRQQLERAALLGVRAGELLAEVEKNKGVRSQLQGRDVSGGSIVRPPEDWVPTLSELGVSKTQSSRWQKLVKLDERAFEDVVLATKDRAFESMERTQTQSDKAHRSRLDVDLQLLSVEKQ